MDGEHGGLGFACHRRISGRAACRVSGRRTRRRGPGRARLRRRCIRASRPPQHLQHELRHPGEDERACRRVSTEDLARLGELWNDGLKQFRRAVSGRQGFYERRRVLLPGRVSRADLWAEGRCDFAAYVQRLLELPAMQEWYKAGLAETTRIERYEEDARAAGEVTEDLRAAMRVSAHRASRHLRHIACHLDALRAAARFGQRVLRLHPQQQDQRRRRTPSRSGRPSPPKRRRGH